MTVSSVVAIFGPVGHHHHRNSGPPLRTRRRRKRPPESLYGSLKMWAHLQRQGIPVARRTVERICATTVGEASCVLAATAYHRARPAAGRAPDLVGRRWRVAAPNLLAVADFTYVPLDTGGFGYTAFVVDAYAGLIPGWECSMVKTTGSSSGRCVTLQPSEPVKAIRSTTRLYSSAGDALAVAPNKRRERADHRVNPDPGVAG